VVSCPGTSSRDAALVGFGFRDALWPDVPHRALLDPVTGATPVVLVSADLHCCWLNSAAARTYGWTTHPTGVLRETDWHPIMEDTRNVPAHRLDVWAGEAAQAAAARGVVGVIDFEAPWQLDARAGRISRGCTAPLDPWVSIAAAVRRSADDRPSWHREQEILRSRLAASTGPDGPIRVGRRADMIVTEDDPAELGPSAPRTLSVAGTMVGGRWTHRAGLESL
jgi:predicted amidohydrolase YtcJ